MNQIWFCNAKVRWKGNAQAHTSSGTVFVYYLFLESQGDLLSASARRELDRELKMCQHMHKLTHQPVAAHGYVGISSSANQHRTTAATSHQCPPDEIHLFHPPTPALSGSLPLNLFCLFWFLSRAFFPLLSLSLSAWCLLTCSPSQYTPLPLLLLFSCDRLSVVHWEWVEGFLQIKLDTATTAKMAKENGPAHCSVCIASSLIPFLCKHTNWSSMWLRDTVVKYGGQASYETLTVY